MEIGDRVKSTNGSGVASVAIAPPLRSSPTNGGAITLVRPTVTMMLASDRNGSAFEQGFMGRHSFIFDLVEVF